MKQKYKTWIKDGLREYLQEEHAVWHMPGHKRKACFGDFTDELYAWDVTEVPGTDDLYLPEGFIGRSLEQLAEIYHTCASYYVVNGATGGIFAAIAACTNPGDAVLIARNCHKSVYNAVSVLQRTSLYVEPTWKSAEVRINCGNTEEQKQKKNGTGSARYQPDGMQAASVKGYVAAEDVERLLANHPEIRAVVVTSPTYEGVISDIRAIAEAAHAHGAYLLVDEAHGAHLPFLKPELSAINKGADLVVQSLHKTLPAVTQTALLHVCNRELVQAAHRSWEIFMSSSPSYIFMMSMESAVCFAADADHTAYRQALADFRAACADRTRFRKIRLLTPELVVGAGAYGLDETRLVFSAPLSGPEFAELLERCGHVVCEMAGVDYVVLISTMADTEADFATLLRALVAAEAELCECGNPGVIAESEMYVQGHAETAELEDTDASEMRDDERLSPHDNRTTAETGEVRGNKIRTTTETDDLSALVGTRACAPIYVYPPGSYLADVGEEITEELAEQLRAYRKAGIRIRGLDADAN